MIHGGDRGAMDAHGARRRVRRCSGLPLVKGGNQKGLLSSVLRWTGWEEGGEYVGVGEDAWKGLIEGE